MFFHCHAFRKLSSVHSANHCFRPSRLLVCILSWRSLKFQSQFLRYLPTRFRYTVSQSVHLLSAFPAFCRNNTLGIPSGTHHKQMQCRCIFAAIDHESVQQRVCSGNEGTKKIVLKKLWMKMWKRNNFNFFFKNKKKTAMQKLKIF